jgi:LysM repeat protein
MRRAGVAIATTAVMIGMTAPSAPILATESSATTESPPTLTGAAQAEQPAGTPPVQPVHYTVVPGDSLSSIAIAHGLNPQTGWMMIYDANPAVVNPDLIYPGTQLRIPAPDEQLPHRPRPTPPPPASNGGDRAAPRTARRTSAPARSGGGVWDRLAQCESGGNWKSTAGRYDGGLQFHPQTWNAYGGRQYAPSADQASREQQIAVAERVRASQGWGAWPACSRRLGLR